MPVVKRKHPELRINDLVLSLQKNRSRPSKSTACGIKHSVDYSSGAIQEGIHSSNFFASSLPKYSPPCNLSGCAGQKTAVPPGPSWGSVHSSAQISLFLSIMQDGATLQKVNMWSPNPACVWLGLRCSGVIHREEWQSGSERIYQPTDSPLQSPPETTGSDRGK